MNVQSPLRMKVFNSQSFHPALPSQTTWELSGNPASIAVATKFGLRHSSIKNFST
jgi:hypothetical protein